ncbi:Predicted extracellular nuclease [Rhodovulum sp. ES.010]|uniref:ExeM/NucH family extracellular endonuclease n=1 Tax=Rhodovulum sp. ES.010 TaxID=1882821 RepID=UPI000929D3B2|nr:ExeM/NucH family extracellular endonuclease [Rhodovulum sp. ES.010]SIO33634.1 Predicted extracellular nuclease [Rhodovulum sp. ES.010]
MPSNAISESGLVIAGVIDGPLSGGLPKAVEIYVREDIADLSVYGLGSANNGGGTDGEEFTFPAGAASAGSYIYVASETSGFTTFFGFAPDFTSSALQINGDDAIELFKGGAVVDLFGAPDTDGTGEPWEHLDGWAARTPGTGPSATFDPADWRFSGSNALDGETANDSAAAPFPLQGYGALSPVINEFQPNPDGADPAIQTVEIKGSSGAAFEGRLYSVEADSSDAGRIDRVAPVSGTFDENGLLTVEVPDLENPSFTYILTGDDAFAVEDEVVRVDTPASLARLGTVLDAIGVPDSAGDEANLIGAELGGTDFSYTGAEPELIFRDRETGVLYAVNDAVAPSAEAVAADGTVVPLGSFDATPVTDSFGAVNPSLGDGGGDPFADVKIHEVQGSTDLANKTEISTGDQSPLLGEAVRVQAVVTQVLPDLGGFFIQEENADVDVDAFSSEGVFVESAEPVSVGDLVTVEASVIEAFGETRLDASGVTVESSGNDLPAATLVTFPTATVLADDSGGYVANLEAYEGMRIVIPEAMSVSEFFNLDRFGEIRVSADGRPVQFTQENAPDVAGYDAHLQNVAARSIVLDDGQSIQNPPVIEVPFLGTDGTLDKGDVFRMGDEYTELAGVVSYAFDEYRIHDPESGTLTAVNDRPAAPEDVGGSLKVTAFNVLNYFSTIDTNPGSFNGPYITGPAEDQEPRGASTLSFDGQSEFERQEAKLVAAISAVAADVIGLVEIENDPLGSTSLMALTAALNAAGGSYGYVAAGPIEGAMGGTLEGDAIKVGFLYDTTSVELAGDAAILDETVDPRFQTVDVQRPALAQTFTEIATGESFTAVVNHFKSKGSVINGETAIGDGQGNNNPTRTEAAEALVDWLATDPTGSGDEDFLILGDLNAYATEDPIRAIKAGADDAAGTADDYTDLVESLDPGAYSYVFDGQTGTLDYALANGSLAAQVTGATVWNVNADEPDAFDYNLDFGRPGDLFSPDAFRSSDHDPVVVGLDLESDPVSTVYTLELLHVTDQEPLNVGGTFADIVNASAVMNALEEQDLGDDGIADNTIRLSSGDAIIPGLFYSASEAVFGSAGIADIQIQNELGLQAIAFGNHEFDFGTGDLAALIDGSAPGDFSALIGSSLEGLDFTGTDMPYLSANLDFSTDANLAPLEVAGGQAPQANAVTSSTVLEEGGELIGVVGATTPTLDIISSPGDVGIAPADFDASPTPAQLDALAAEIQAEVDALLADNPDMNKVILLAHMQQIAIEQELAARLTDVDVIVAGGSNTRLFDGDDRARNGDSDQGSYPILVENAGGTTTAVVNTDGSYKYVGRLVVDFDADGNIVPESYDETVSGAYATDAQGVADLDAAGLIDPEIQTIVDAIEDQVIATEGNVFGFSDVFLNGNRSGDFTAGDSDGVRTQETNLGNLTADANLAVAQSYDSSVMVSIKNGGGIRASIGETVVPPGGAEFERVPNQQVFDSDGNLIKDEGGISQNDIETTLAFNNSLSLLTLTRAELVAVLEHGLGALPGVSGRFPQVSGVQFSFDPDLPAGGRIVSAAITDADGNDLDVLVRDGELVGDADASVRIVTLNFLAGGGDGFPFPQGPEANRVDLDDRDGDGISDGAFTGVGTFAEDGTEQDALAEYLAEVFGDEAAAFDMADTGPAGDERIQNLDFRDDTVIDAPAFTVIAGEGGRDRLTGTDAPEVFVSGEGRFETMTGFGGADVFYFGEEALNGARERDVITDFEVGVDAIALAPGVSVASIREAGPQVAIYLDDPAGFDDAIFVRGEGLTADNITILDDYLLAGV